MAFDLLGNLAQLGFFDLLLPWTLFFAIVYGLLSKVPLFGADGKGDKINIVISIVIAFFGVNYSTIGVNVGRYLTNLFGIGSLALSVVLIITLGAALMGGGKLFDLVDFSDKTKRIANLGKLGLLLAIVGIGAYYFTGGRGFGNVNIYAGSELLTTIVIVVIMLAVVAFAMWSPKDKPAAATTAGHA